MLLSVIVPAYKFENYIKECVRSILDQNTNFDFEILVGDDYSCDLTNDILRQEFPNDERLIIIERTENLGPFYNIKDLIERARGKYIAYIDGDDYYTDSSKIQRQIDFLESHPDYILHSTGNLMLHPDKGIMPEDGSWIAPLYPEPGPSELIKANVVGFGRVFRNVENIVKPWMAGAPYFDWLLNFELSLRGKIYCDSTCTGVYRLSPQGMFSLKSEEEKNKENREITRLLERRMSEEFKNKKITIIDCFIQSDSIKSKLKDAIRKIKSTGSDVMLVSNTSADKDIIDMCDFYLYDRRNQLFRKEYTNVVDVHFFNSTGSFIAYNIKPGLQRHGLSVLVNLFNALDVAKSMGYTHFQRIECDDIFGETSLEFMTEIPDIVGDNKKGLFYLNESPDENNISFHYFYCEIDYFLNSVNRINNENDYVEYLLRENGNLDFVIAESYVYDNLMKSGRDNIISKSGSEDMNLDFSDTIWNTETSGSNIDEKYNGCITEIYRTYRNNEFSGNVIYSYNYGEFEKEREIDIYTKASGNYTINHSCGCRGAWTYTEIPDDIIYIDVYEDGIKLYSQKIEDVKSYLNFE